MASAFRTSVDNLTGNSDQREYDQVTITREDSPLIFAIIEHCRALDDAQLKSLLAYLDRSGGQV